MLTEKREICLRYLNENGVQIPKLFEIRDGKEIPSAMNISFYADGKLYNAKGEFEGRFSPTEGFHQTQERSPVLWASGFLQTEASGTAKHFDHKRYTLDGKPSLILNAAPPGLEKILSPVVGRVLEQSSTLGTEIVTAEKHLGYEVNWVSTYEKVNHQKTLPSAQSIAREIRSKNLQADSSGYWVLSDGSRVGRDAGGYFTDRAAVVATASKMEGKFLFRHLEVPEREYFPNERFEEAPPPKEAPIIPIKLTATTDSSKSQKEKDAPVLPPPVVQSRERPRDLKQKPAQPVQDNGTIPKTPDKTSPLLERPTPQSDPKPIALTPIIQPRELPELLPIPLSVMRQPIPIQREQAPAPKLRQEGTTTKEPTPDLSNGLVAYLTTLEKEPTMEEMKFFADHLTKQYRLTNPASVANNGQAIKISYSDWTNEKLTEIRDDFFRQAKALRGATSRHSRFTGGNESLVVNTEESKKDSFTIYGSESSLNIRRNNSSDQGHASLIPLLVIEGAR